MSRVTVRREVDRPLSTADVVRVAVPLALLFGTLEALEIAALRFVPNVQPMAKVSLDILWAAPLAHLTLNAVLAVALAIAGRVGVLRRASVAVGVFVFFGALGVSAYSGALGRVSPVLLSAGLAVQVGRSWTTRGSRALARLGVVLAVFIVASVLVLQWPVRRGIGNVAARTAAGQVPMNVLVLVLDTVRADRLSAYGYPRSQTPNIDALAREGALFERAYATSSWTLPTHASLLTGLPASQHGALSIGDSLASDRLQLQQVLLDQGYATGAFVANNYFFIPERGFARGFDVFDAHDPQSVLARTAFALLAKPLLRRLDVDLDPTRPASVINSRFEGWLRTVGRRPFFAVLNYMEAHEPYRAGGQRPDLRLWDRRSHRSAADNQLLDRAYDRAISALDSAIGELVADLKQQRVWNQTLVVVVADHGEAIEDGRFDHGSDLTVEQIHVPLIFRLPGRIAAGSRIAEPVSVADVAPTIEALLGLNGERRLPGRSLSDWFSGTRALLERAGPQGVFSEVTDPNTDVNPPRLRSVILGQLQFIVRLDTGEERLFNALTDPAGKTNLAGTSTREAALQQLRDTLRLGVRDPRPPSVH